MTAEEILWSEDFKKCIDFHGHICPGVTIGFQAARVLMERLGVQKAPDEELVAIVENDSCSADAIQIMTGCTFGKGNFIFKNYGKQAFSLIDRKREKAIRVCLLAGALEGDPERLSLFEKVRTEKASPEEKDRYQQLQRGRIRNILDATAESLFKIEEISPDIPPKAMIMESGICDFCGESTKIDLLRKMNDKEVCIPCAHQSPQSDQSA
jgi:formylmethanofuran dehydrogenase subunit E